VEETLTRLVAEALNLVTGANHVSVTRRAMGKLTTPATSDDTALLCDARQYQLRQGPCIDVVSGAQLAYSGRLAHEARWPKFGPSVAREHSIHSLLSLHLYAADPATALGLNLYAEEEDSFTEPAASLAVILAAEGELAIAHAAAAEKAAHLEKALQTNRDIGIAVGILMSHHRINPQTAFDLLKRASQNKHRKLASIAADVIYTGTLDTART
jgi:hypothetical protein